MSDLKPMPNREIWIFGAQFDNPRTGGQLYNAEIVKYIKSKTDKLVPKSYPWSNELNNFWYDLSNALLLAFSFKKRIVVIDESLHQRLALTLITSLFCPWIKTVIMFHQLAYLRRANRLHWKFTRWVDQILISRSSMSISAGLYLTDQMKNLVAEKYHKKIYPVLTTCQRIMPFNNNKKPYSAAFVGTITRSKGILEMIEAVNLLPEELKQQLEIGLAGSLGDESFVATCKAKIKQYRLENQFQFLGLLGVAEVEKLYFESEIYMFPTHAEGMPMSLMEAMTAGCIPLVFNNTAMPYMIEHLQTGLMSENLNVEEYAKNLEVYFSLSPEEKSRLRHNAQKRALKYAREWKSVAEEYYQSLLLLD